MAVIANVIEANSPGILDYLIYPEQNPLNQSYIYNQITNISNTLDDIDKKFIESSKEVYAKINDSELVRRAKMALRSAVGISHINEIVYYNTLEAIQSAVPYMQNYIMANPMIRELYNQQLCDGYSDTYTDIDKNTIGDKHYHYRRVMDAVVQDTTDSEGNYDWVSKNYMEDLLEGDRELEIDEKAKILSTWEVMNMFIKAGQDPTNPRGGSL